jgi:hypothetical protein
VPEQQQPLLHEAIDVAQRAGLSAADVEREKRIAQAAAVVVSARDAGRRLRAMDQIRSEVLARSPAMLAAIARDRAAPCG